MTTRRESIGARVAGPALAALLLAGGLAAAASASLPAAAARPSPVLHSPAQTRAALAQAQAQARSAAARARQLSGQAEAAGAEADRTAATLAALAAEVQQAEAEIAAAEARMALIGGQRAALAADLARQQAPLIKLTAALQNIARRPVLLAALRPGDLRETVYLRAVLETAVPHMRQRTAALQRQLDRGKELEAQSRHALTALRAGEASLAERRRALAGLEARQRFAAAGVRSSAAREAERALALSEEARDLDALVGQLGRDAALRARLAALPGPVLRPDQGGAAPVVAAAPTDAPTGAPARFQLPVAGRTIAGFGTVDESGRRTSGLALAPRAGAQVVAPAGGRIAFAGPYRGYGQIVIIEHGGGWASLVTGLGETRMTVGQSVVAGAPIGRAGGQRPVIRLELRQGATPVDPLQHLR